MKDIEKHLIYKVRVGSHAYGTNIATSDMDYAGIFIQPLDSFFGLNAFDLMSDQSEDDKSYYSLRKFAHLALANNPNVLEILFVDPSDIIIDSPFAQELRKHRHLFLSQRCKQTFIGYSKAQLNRIQNHTRWLGQELKAMEILKPYLLSGRCSKDWAAWRFGENIIERLEKELEGPNNKQLKLIWETNTTPKEKKYMDELLLPLLKGLGICCPEKDDPQFMKEGRSIDDVMGAQWYKTFEFQKHLYDEAKKKRDQYVTWMKERNPDRHKNEILYGYDVKHASHLVRLLRTGYDILTTGTLQVRRPDALELLDIRNGAWSYEKITSYADEMIDKINALTVEECKVPEKPDVSGIDNLIIDITKRYLFNGKDATDKA